MFGKFVTDFLEGKEFISAIPLIDEYGQTTGIGVFYTESIIDGDNPPTKYKELYRSEAHISGNFCEECLTFLGKIIDKPMDWVEDNLCAHCKTR